jgi:hypothetical protein
MAQAALASSTRICVNFTTAALATDVELQRQSCINIADDILLAFN